MPVDPSKLAKAIIDLATGQGAPDPDGQKDPAAVSRGRKGGLKGGKARASKMSREDRVASAKKAIQARWAKKP